MTTEVNGIYEDLHEIGVVRSQYELSRWMGQSESYFSSIKARDRELGTGALIALYMRVDEILAALAFVRKP